MKYHGLHSLHHSVSLFTDTLCTYRKEKIFRYTKIDKQTRSDLQGNLHVKYKTTKIYSFRLKPIKFHVKLWAQVNNQKQINQILILKIEQKFMHEIVTDIKLLNFFQKQSQEVFYKKKSFLEILQNLQENTCARVSFLIKLQIVKNMSCKERQWLCKTQNRILYD